MRCFTKRCAHGCGIPRSSFRPETWRERHPSPVPPALLITGRYHPAVFAAPAGVPVLGLVTDDYTAVKQRGALAHWGQDATVPISAADVDGIPRLHSLLQHRERIAAEARTRLPGHRADFDAWWDSVADAFG